MNIRLWIGTMVSVIVGLQDQARSDERGLSQSTENAILLAGAVAIALAVIGAVGAYVSSHMPK